MQLGLSPGFGALLALAVWAAAPPPPVLIAVPGLVALKSEHRQIFQDAIFHADEALSSHMVPGAVPRGSGQALSNLFGSSPGR